MMYILSSLIDSSWQIINNFKKILVGDLTFQDIIRFGRERALPEHLTQTLKYVQEKKHTPFPDGSNCLIANYGLFGRIAGMNTAVVIGKPEKPTDLKKLIDMTDNISNGRAPYKIAIRTIGTVPVLASRSGREAFDAHNNLIKVLPSREFVLETAVRFTHEAFDSQLIQNKRDCEEVIQGVPEIARRMAKNKNLDEKWEQCYINDRIAAIKKDYEDIPQWIGKEHLVQRIMAHVLLGFELKEEHYKLIGHMKLRDKNVICEYRAFVDEVLDHQKTNPLPQSSLSKALNQQHIQPDDPLIYELVNVLVTAQNVSAVVNIAINTSKFLDTFIAEIRTTPQDANKRKILEYSTLKKIFECALHEGNFEPASLPRYLENSLVWEGQTIPAGTNVFIQHRSLDTETKHYAFSLGKRSCPGSRLAEYIFKGIYTTLVERQYLNESQTPAVIASYQM